MYTDDWFYTLSTFPFIEKALNSNHLSLKHVFKQLSTDWLDVTEIDSPYYWYLRISVTDRCNFRCFRCDCCMPKEIFGDDYTFLPKNELLTFEELTRISKIYAQLGVKKIRITGGEPLLRRNLYKLVEQLNLIDGIEDID